MGRTVRGFIIGLGLAVLVAAPVAAGGEESRSFERGHTASASESTCREVAGSDVVKCSNFSVQVFRGRRGGTEPASRFRGYEVTVTKDTETIDGSTGKTIRWRSIIGRVRNVDSLTVRFDGLRDASVTGTMRVSDMRCDRRGECEESKRQMALDLDWTPTPDPASSAFLYYRVNDRGCETTYSQTLRLRTAWMAGEFDGSDVRVRGDLVRTDSVTTQVCQ